MPQEPQDTSFFTAAAALFGAGAIAASLSAQTAPSPTNDIAILNYALSLENLEATFYTQGLKQFSNVDFNNSALASSLGDSINGDVYAYLSLIRDHENTHVRTLQSVITSLGGTPVKVCTYNFGYKTATDFLTTAAALENTGVSAYDGAINMLSSATLKTSSATIATIEARHAAYLNLITGTSPFPSAFDTPKSMTDVLNTASQFIVSCPS